MQPSPRKATGTGTGVFPPTGRWSPPPVRLLRRGGSSSAGARRRPGACKGIRGVKASLPHAAGGPLLQGIQAVKLRHFPVGRGRIGREGNPRGVHLSGQGRRRTGAGYVQGHVRAQQALAGQGAGRAAAIHAQEAAALFQGRGQGGAAAATQIRHQIPGLAHPGESTG